MYELKTDLLTREEALQMVGLMTLARMHINALDDIRKAMVGQLCPKTGLPADEVDSRVSDALWGRDLNPVENLNELFAGLEFDVKRQAEERKEE